MPSTFSYAQAAKGLSAPASKQTLESAAPFKDAESGKTVWADEPMSTEAPGTNGVSKPISADSLTARARSASRASNDRNGSQSRSPEFGTSSASTLPKEDDVSSIPNASSESTWENKSQASNVPDASSDHESSAKPNKKKGSKKGEPAPKPFQDAPIPVVNPWTKRAEAAAKAKFAQPQQSAKGPYTTGRNATELSGYKGAEKPAGGEPARESSIQDRKSVLETVNKSRSNDRSDGPRRNNRSDKTSSSKDSKPSHAHSLSVANNEELWPTPEIAQDEEKKRGQGKPAEKADKETTRELNARSHGKTEWVHVPYTPSAVFNTPLPNSSGKRGGRGGGRGGKDHGSRASYAGVGTDKSPAVPPMNSDLGKRGRAEGKSAGDNTTRPKRASSSVSTTRKDTIGGESSANQSGNADGHSRRNMQETPTAAPPNSHANTFPRSYGNGRPKGRKFDALNLVDRPKEGENINGRNASSSPTPSRRESLVQNGDGFPTFESQAYPTRSGVTDRRGGYGSFVGRDREGRGRGGLRGGGRGGAHSVSGSHHYSQPFNGGQLPPIQTPSTFSSLPRSPPVFVPQQQSPFLGNESSHRYRNSISRSQSGSGENGFSRNAPPYSAFATPLTPMQPFMGGMYDYPIVPPMSAQPFPPVPDNIALMNMVAMQVEYYFSVDNLCKDLFLRKNMDSQGFVFLSVIADFNRIKQLTTDFELIKHVCYQSGNIDYKIGEDGVDRIRKYEGWQQWILAMKDRHESAQNDGPAQLHNPPVPHPPGMEVHYVGRPSPISPNGIPPSPGMMAGGMFRPVNGPVMNGFDTSNMGPPVQLDHQGTDAQPVDESKDLISNAADDLLDQESRETDSFSDDQVENLTVIVRSPEASSSSAEPPAAATRSFSNGSINSESISEVLNRSDGRRGSTQADGQSKTTDDGKRLFDTHEQKDTQSGSSDPQESTHSRNLYWVKNSEKPLEASPPSTTTERYHNLRSRALSERVEALDGNGYQDMTLLYQFWSHFLIRNFNRQMYNEFRDLAFKDAAEKNSHVGLQNLREYYSKALASASPIRESVAQHYIDLVNSEHASTERTAFKQLRTAWRDGALNMRNRKKIHDLMDPELKASLEQ